MKMGLILAGEPMGLMIARTTGALESVKDYTLATAGGSFMVPMNLVEQKDWDGIKGICRKLVS